MRDSPTLFRDFNVRPRSRKGIIARTKITKAHLFLDEAKGLSLAIPESSPPLQEGSRFRPSSARLLSPPRLPTASFLLPVSGYPVHSFPLVRPSSPLWVEQTMIAEL